MKAPQVARFMSFTVLGTKRQRGQEPSIPTIANHLRHAFRFGWAEPRGIVTCFPVLQHELIGLRQVPEHAFPKNLEL